MSDTYDRRFGQEAGLGKRLAYWANQLSLTVTYPWVGTGLIDDLLCASRVLGADPAAMFPANFGSPEVVALDLGVGGVEDYDL